MKKIFSASVLAALLAGHPASAQDCNEPTTQVEMNLCAGKQAATADAELNAVYKDIMSRLDDRPEAKKALRDAQRAWIRFRDAECAFRTVDSRTGSIYPTLLANCTADITQSRADALKSLTECEEGDISCPLP